jgi:hypothetical protein
MLALHSVFHVRYTVLITSQNTYCPEDINTELQTLDSRQPI